MYQYLVTAGIRFTDYVFSEPRRLVEWTPAKFAGICVILGRNPNWGPRQFQSLCFWEFDANTDLGRLARMPHAEILFFSVLALPYSTSAQRIELRNHLVWAYNPVWQAMGGSPRENELASKLNELERKHEEQTTQFRLLLASINRFFEPQAEPARRRSIGFSPAPVKSVESQAYTSLKFAETRA